MRSRRCRTVWLAALANTVAWTVGVAGHDFWIHPSSFEAAVGEPVRIQLRVGERFAGEAVTRNEARIERFVLAGPSGEQAVVGRDGRDPAGLLRLSEPGIWFVGYRSKPSSVELAASAFEQYLGEEGLERIIEERAKRNESQSPGRERFSRSVKSLLRTAGSAGARGYDRALGLTLEFVLEADPIAVLGSGLPIRLLFEGAPLDGALVIAFRRSPGTSTEALEAARARTDPAGRVQIPLTPGVWLVKAVHMRRAPADAAAEWESVWTSLTFAVP